MHLSFLSVAIKELNVLQQIRTKYDKTGVEVCHLCLIETYLPLVTWIKGNAWL